MPWHSGCNSVSNPLSGLQFCHVCRKTKTLLHPSLCPTRPSGTAAAGGAARRWGPQGRRWGNQPTPGPARPADSCNSVTFGAIPLWSDPHRQLQQRSPFGAIPAETFGAIPPLGRSPSKPSERSPSNPPLERSPLERSPLWSDLYLYLYLARLRSCLGSTLGPSPRSRHLRSPGPRQLQQRRWTRAASTRARAPRARAARARGPAGHARSDQPHLG